MVAGVFLGSSCRKRSALLPLRDGSLVWGGWGSRNAGAAGKTAWEGGENLGGKTLLQNLFYLNASQALREALNAFALL